MNRFFVQDGEEYAVRHVLAIECKKSNSRPWVFFCSEPVSYDQNVGDIHGLGFSGQWFRGGHKQWRIFQRRHPWFSRNIRGRAYFEPFSSGAEANATIVKALLASVKALLELKESGFAAGLGSNRSNIVFYYPLVVLQGDLFIARLINNELVVEEVDSVPVAINYQSPSYVGQDRFTVLVAKESALARETGALDKWLEYVSQHLRKHLAVFETPEATADAADA